MAETFAKLFFPGRIFSGDFVSFSRSQQAERDSADRELRNNGERASARAAPRHEDASEEERGERKEKEKRLLTIFGTPEFHGTPAKSPRLRAPLRKPPRRACSITMQLNVN